MVIPRSGCGGRSADDGTLDLGSPGARPDPAAAPRSLLPGPDRGGPDPVSCAPTGFLMASAARLRNAKSRWSSAKRWPASCSPVHLCRTTWSSRPGRARTSGLLSLRAERSALCSPPSSAGRRIANLSLFAFRMKTFDNLLLDSREVGPASTSGPAASEVQFGFSSCACGPACRCS